MVVGGHAVRRRLPMLPVVIVLIRGHGGLADVGGFVGVGGPVRQRGRGGAEAGDQREQSCKTTDVFEPHA